MKPRHEFGKETREMELARILKRRKNIRRALIIIPLLLLTILILSFKADIKKMLSSSGKDKTMISGKSKEKGSSTTDGNVKVVQRWDLPADLTEISGFAWMDKERFACVQDEKGIVYIYNSTKGVIEKEISFAGTGDYEGLALVGETIWVIRSDGHLYEISSIGTEKPVIKEYDTPLNAQHNTEGLCYDQKNNRLLVAIKESDAGGSDSKGIYGFDLSSKKMNEHPVFTIDLKNEIFAGQSSSKKKAKSGEALLPSEIAVHPVSGDIYITEGRVPKLLIIDGTTAIRKLYVLDKTEFLQPEGITFSPSGELFVSNEGTKKPGNILKLELDLK